MGRRLSRLSGRIRSIFASDTFFYVVLAVFALGSIWVATASLYPMAFDEDFHMGLINIYSHGWIPYGIEQTEDMAVYGPAAADASYLFHYLLSFPYRVLTAFSVPLDVIVVLLRLLNIGMVIAALVVFRKVLQEAGISRAVTNLSLALFTLIPIVPVLAGQVNYDNLLLLIVALTFLFTVRISKTLLRGGYLPVITTWALFITILLGMPTKFAYLPLAAGIITWVLIVIFRVRGNASPMRVITRFIRDSQNVSQFHKIVIAGLVFLGFFFSFHYVTNYLQYSDPIPLCDKVFNETACMAYGPWRRNHSLAQQLPPTFNPVSLPVYIGQDWIPGMVLRLTFAVAGPTNTYQTKQPLTFLRPLLVVLTILGILCLSVMIFFKRRYRLLSGVTALASGVYLIPLVWKLYETYMETGQPVAINGRYLLLILPPLTALLIVGMVEALRKARMTKFIPLLGGMLFLLIILTGGGIATYVLLAEPHWFWQGWGQTSHDILRTVFGWFTLR